MEPNENGKCGPFSTPEHFETAILQSFLATDLCYPATRTVRENARAHLRVLVKRILRKYGYPPDKQEKATLTVLEQACPGSYQP
jgi:Domain of unknown function (DUF3387)